MRQLLAFALALFFGFGIVHLMRVGIQTMFETWPDDFGSHGPADAPSDVLPGGAIVDRQAGEVSVSGSSHRPVARLRRIGEP